MAPVRISKLVDSVLQAAQEIYAESDRGADARCGCLLRIARTGWIDAVVDRCESWGKSLLVSERELCCDALGALAHLFPEADVDLPVHVGPPRVIQMLEALVADPEPVVAQAAVDAFCHYANYDERSLLSLVEHDSDGVRTSLARTLHYRNSEEATSGLLELARDPSRDVRSWAVFALADPDRSSAPHVRRCLLEVARDLDDEVRGEALLGLAEADDEQAVSLLMDYFENSPCVGTLAVEAARRVASARLYLILVELRGWWDLDPELLEEAIHASQPKLRLVD